jgi:peptidyl-prolyl cis-trans isomerase C
MKKKRMKLVTLFVGIFLTLTLFDTSAGTNPEKEEKVASVNGVAILKKDLLWAVSSEEQRIITSGKALGSAERKILENNILDDLINRELLFQESRKMSIIVTDPEVDAAYDSLIESIPRDIDINKMNEEMNLTETDIKEEFRRVMSIQKMLDKSLVYEKSVTEEEMKGYYDSNPERLIVGGQVRASHILIKTDSKFTPKQKAHAKKRILEIKEKLDLGEDFSQMAKDHSEGPSRVKGGDLGFFNRGQMAKAFEDAAFELEQGQVSDIIETNFGYHIIKLFERIPGKKLDYNNIRNQLEEYLKKEKVNQAQIVFIQKLKEKAKIRVTKDH